MSRISVITAVNPGYWNPGMLTVDLAFADFCAQAAPGTELRWFVPYGGDMVQVRPRPYVNPAELPFRFQVIGKEGSDFTDADAIVFWGDFLQARHYIVGEAAGRLVSAGIATNQSEAIVRLSEILLLAKAPESVRRKVIISGSTILHNRQSDYTDPAYGPAFMRLMREAKGAWMRDPLSAVKVAHLRGQLANMAQGIDSAFLLSDTLIDSLRTSDWSAGTGTGDRIGVFFGGRTTVNANAAVTFAEELASACGSKADWLPWFGFEYPRYVPASEAFRRPAASIEYRRARPRVEKLMRQEPAPTFGDLLHALRRYRLVVTDTYHVCVNSWRAGTPAVCVSSSTPLGGDTPEALSLSDFKKMLLYSMYDASDYYVESDALLDPRRRADRIRALVQTVSDPSNAAAIAARTKEHSFVVKSNLTLQIRELQGS